LRNEELLKAKILAYVYGPTVVVQEIESDNVEVIETTAKGFYHKTINHIRQTQRNSQSEAVDGFILFKDVVYKVPKGGSDVIKVTGDEARSVKRKVKQQEPVVYQKAA
jgi:hypothetical protein